MLNLDQSNDVSRRHALWGLAAILLVAAFLRLWALDLVPRGLSHDEANNGLMATEVLNGFHPVFFEIYTGVEPGLIYPLSLAFKLLGPGAFAERFVSAAFGLLTVGLTYAFAVHLFRSRWLGLLSALFAALSFWHTFVSRLALRAVLMPPLQMLALIFFWRGLERHRLRDFALAGLFGGLTMYTYLSSRFLPFVPLVYVLYLLVRRVKLRQVWLGLALMVGAWTVTFLPLGIYYLNNPHWFFYRADQALVIAQPGQGGLAALLEQTLATLGMFSFAGDASWRYNLAGKPVFDWVLALAFYAGVVIVVIRSVRTPKLNPYSFVVITQLIMLVPDFITDGSPHFLRTIGAIPTTFIFPAVSLVALYGRLQGRWRGLWVLLLGGWALFTGLVTCRDYFGTWAENPEARRIYNAAYAEIAEYLQEHPADAEALVSSSDPDLDRVSFALSANSEPPAVRWFNGTQVLVLPSRQEGGGRYYVPNSFELLPSLRDLLANGPEAAATEDDILSFEIIPIGQVSDPEESFSASFGDLVNIVGYDVRTPVFQAGESLDLHLYWQVATNPDPRRRWTWFLHVVDRRGYMWANWTGQGFEVADWRPGDLVIQHVSLGLPFDAPDIAYQLELGVFDRLTGERLLATGDESWVTLRDIRIVPTQPESVEGLIASHGTQRLGDNLQFLGATQSVQQTPRGSDLTLTLAWAPSAPLVQDYGFDLRLVTEDRKEHHLLTWSPLAGEFPTSKWPVGRIVRDVLFLSIPADVPQGRVTLFVSAEGLAGEVRAADLEIIP